MTGSLSLSPGKKRDLSLINSAFGLLAIHFMQVLHILVPVDFVVKLYYSLFAVAVSRVLYNLIRFMHILTIQYCVKCSNLLTILHMQPPILKNISTAALYKTRCTNEVIVRFHTCWYLTVIDPAIICAIQKNIAPGLA